MADIVKINEKLAKGEALTAEETKEVMSMPNAEGAVVEVDEDDKIDWNEAEDLGPDGKPIKKEPDKTKEEPKKEEKKTQEPAKQSEEKSKETQTPPKTEPEKEDIFVRLERELAKPDGQEDLSKYTEREKAYFHQMKRDRKAKQVAEEARDAALFREIKAKKEPEKETPPEEDIITKLEKKDPTDFLTVKEVTEIVKTLKAEKPKPSAAYPDGMSPMKRRFLIACEKEARQGKEDWDEVTELSEELIKNNPEYLTQIAQAMVDGENPAEKTYQLIKADKDFKTLLPVAQARVQARRKPATTQEKTPEEKAKEQKAKEAEDALENNANKTKTTAHAAGGGAGGAENVEAIDGYKIEEIMKMSDLTFSKLPKATRNKFLQKYG